MSLGFLVFNLLIIIGFIYIIRSKKKVFIIYLLLVFVFVLLMRNDPKGVDFVEYYRYLHNVDGIRYYREFVYFSIGLLVYKVVHSEILTFILMDFLWLYALLSIQKEVNKRFNTEDYSLFVVLFTSFPLFFGYENIYRQLFAEIFSLYAYSIREQKGFKSNLFFLMAVFMHNTALLMLPFLIIKKFFKFNFKFRVFIATSVSLVFSSLLTIASHYKSGHETGLDMSIFYLAIFYCLIYIYLIKNKFNMFKVIFKFPSLYISAILLTALFMLPLGMITERLGMFFLIFVMYDLYIYTYSMSKYKQILLRIGLLLLFSLPVVVFNSSKIML